MIAQGPDLRHRLRTVLRTGERMLLGRDPGVTISIPWDPLISRRHVQLQVHDQDVEVQRLAGTANPVFFHGESVDQFLLVPDTHFVLGSTSFRLESTKSDAVKTPLEERTFSPLQLSKVRYQDPENRLDVLTHLPHVIAGAQGDAELFERLCGLLLRGVVHADAVAGIRHKGIGFDKGAFIEKKLDSVAGGQPATGALCGDLVCTATLLRSLAQLAQPRRFGVNCFHLNVKVNVKSVSRKSVPLGCKVG